MEGRYFHVQDLLGAAALKRQPELGFEPKSLTPPNIKEHLTGTSGQKGDQLPTPPGCFDIRRLHTPALNILKLRYYAEHEYPKTFESPYHLAHLHTHFH